MKVACVDVHWAPTSGMTGAVPNSWPVVKGLPFQKRTVTFLAAVVPWLVKVAVRSTGVRTFTVAGVACKVVRLRSKAVLVTLLT